MAITVTIEPKQITFADSPQFVKAESNGSDGLNTFFQCRIYIWTGLKGSPPASPTRVLQLPAIPTVGNASEALFEISKFLMAAINIEDYPTTYNDGAAVWFYTQITSDADLNTVTSTTNLATAGVGIYQDEANPGTTIAAQNQKIFGYFANKLTASGDVSYRVPIYIGDTSLNTDLNTSLGNIDLAVDLGLTLGSLNSALQWCYVEIGSNQVGWGAWTHYTMNVVGGEAGNTYNIDVDCTITGKKLRYISRSGSVIDLPINGHDFNTEIAERTTFENSVSLYDSTQHNTKTYLSNAATTVELHTGWMSLEANQMVSELITSKRVWYVVGSSVYPCVISSNSVRFINRNYEKQVGYDISIRLANSVLNKSY